MKQITTTTKRVGGLADYIALFNRPKIYVKPDSVAQTASALSFLPLLESEPPKSLWTRLRAFCGRR